MYQVRLCTEIQTSTGAAGQFVNILRPELKAYIWHIYQILAYTIEPDTGGLCNKRITSLTRPYPQSIHLLICQHKALVDSHSFSFTSMVLGKLTHLHKQGKHTALMRL